MDTVSRRPLRFPLQDHGHVLSTRRRGFEAAAHLRRLAQDRVDVVLDFAGVEVVTPPFLFEFLAGVRELLREKPEGGPLVIVMNLDDDVLETLELVLERRKLPLAILRANRVELLQAAPHLEDTLREALELPPRFTVPQLAEKLSLQPTSINERLNPLVESGVLSRERDPSARRGKRYVYRAPTREFVDVVQAPPTATNTTE